MKWYLAALLASGALVYVGKLERDVSLDSVAGIWSDVLRDADGAALKIIRVSAAEEMRLGRELARGIPATADAKVTATGNRLVSWVSRKDIRYEFHVVESSAVNAFALPGGQVFVTRGMLHFLKDDDELAAVMGHEIAHVDLRHCIERFQYQTRLGKMGETVDMARRIVEMGYSQAQELEADEAGWRMAVNAGYDAKAAEAVFARMAKEFGEGSKKRAETPVGEVTGALAGVAGGYFQSHPPSAERAEKLRRLRER